MITIDRGPEPPALARARRKHLQGAVRAFCEHGPGSRPLRELLDNGYQVVKPQLYQRQHKKCAYCERKPGYDGQPVEHIRPKKRAIRRAGSKTITDRERYWWLAWTWHNLLFACATCNGVARKGDHFPLAPGSVPLARPERSMSYPLPQRLFRTTAEHPLLLDPSDRRVDPLDHLRWQPVDLTVPRRYWTWGLKPLTHQGRVTLDRLRLDDRTDDVDDRYRSVVWPRFRHEIDRKLGAVTRPQLLRAWTGLTRGLVNRSSDLTAATWSMLDVLRTSTRALEAARLPEVPRP